MQLEQRATGEAPRARSVAGNVIRGSLGNLIEWYDWYVYAAFSIYFASVFFPSSNPTAQLLNTAGIFAVGFLIRPLGGWLLGWYADRAGRRAALTLSVTMMGVGSLGIAVLPGYAQIGALAPILLVTARLLQGLSLGGEYGTSATYLSEVATPHRRGFYSSFQYVTLTSGQLLALGVQIILQQVLTPEQMHDWGWRIAFVIGAAAAVTVMWLRRTMDESENYKLAVESNTERGSLRVLLTYPRECLTVVGLTLGGTIAFYTFTTYMQKFMINTTGLPKEQVTWINFVALIIFVGLQPMVGALSDRIGRRPILIAFGVGATLCTVPLLTAVSHADSALSAFGLMLLGLIIVSGYTSINAVVKAELFPARIRALGVGLPYALTVAIFGGTTEYVALWLKNIGHESWFFFYVAGCGLISLLVYVFMGESSRRSHLERETRELRADEREQAKVDEVLAEPA
ncbi:MAG: transporter, family, alpha-ketoglutarate permease [Mycobacterium sp.]|jgi:MHS family alpha-ketoglutarate permease-like MFS transporter|nr:transporter, family, alpha-ketoglutarate permease [Mycobacterium sp.]MDT5285866.1 transporter, family, alpha-ketoglutarate permease [Mycobacterium sp.]MDT5301695.1 transporter, family, alpha-ketoglutarate permease [Mycobacterium sp.]